MDKFAAKMNMDTSSIEHRRNILKLTATDECYASTRLLLEHVKEQEERIKALERKAFSRPLTSGLYDPE